MLMILCEFRVHESILLVYLRKLVEQNTSLPASKHTRYMGLICFTVKFLFCGRYHYAKQCRRCYISLDVHGVMPIFINIIGIYKWYITHTPYYNVAEKIKVKEPQPYRYLYTIYYCINGKRHINYRLQVYSIDLRQRYTERVRIIIQRKIKELQHIASGIPYMVC